MGRRGPAGEAWPWVSAGAGRERQARVYVWPGIWNVAVPRPEHAAMVGQRAS